jgi:lysophospholipase L1-like esterase
VKRLCLFPPLCGLLVLAAGPARAAGEFALRDGDRVVLIGNALIEREQRDGYWETALTSRYPERNILFRNLGWSGDTVFGEARAGFGSPADGFRHLKEHVLSLKPTVILVGYGSNEAFEGPAGLPRFTQGLEVLLDTIAPTRARIVLLSPLRQEDLGRPLPDPAAQNKNLRLYRDAIRDSATRRGLLFVDLYDLLGDGAKATPPLPLTDNGIHLTSFGYWKSAAVLERGLGLNRPRWQVEFHGGREEPTAAGATVKRREGKPLSFRVTDITLPAPPAPADGMPKGFAPPAERVLRDRDLRPGSYTLTVDGKPVATATAAEWAAGVSLHRGPEFEQAELLRKAVVAKNLLYFHRWRPQNVTYLFGFRKHEQGQNAREIPEFDPLVAKQEAEIARLRVPVAHTYELTAQVSRPTETKR